MISVAKSNAQDDPVFQLKISNSAVSLLSGFSIKREVTGVHPFPNIIPVSRLLIQGRIHDFDKTTQTRSQLWE
jgi:hypothetical protein